MLKRPAPETASGLKEMKNGPAPETASGLKEMEKRHEPAPAIATGLKEMEQRPAPATAHAPRLTCVYCSVEVSKCECYFGSSYFNEDGKEI